MCNRPCRVPPDPEVLKALYLEYQSGGLAETMGFVQYLVSIGYVDPSVGRDGMDDGMRFEAKVTAAGGVKKFPIPKDKVRGAVRVIVLLVDFSDRPGTHAKAEYERLLFSQGELASGSMRDYYAEVTEGKVQIDGSVHGWLRLPHPYEYYVNGESGMGTPEDSHYPNNAQAMAEDAVKEALAAKVPFPATLDALGNGLVTALVIVHAGPGGERAKPPTDRDHIWSHKWHMEVPVDVGPDLQASTYMTVPEVDCRLGVCAHEFGHLVFQWDDFYDANGNDDGQYWDGSGEWDLMAGGSYNGSGRRPAHPAGLHKLQHGWIEVQEVKPRAKPYKVVLPPYGAPGAKVVRVRSSVFAREQYLLLENRQRIGFDEQLPGEGLLVWRVDERLEQLTPSAGLVLLEANGSKDLQDAGDDNVGDPNDPFPGGLNVTKLGDTGACSTSFPGKKRSGITLSEIAVEADHSVSLTILVTP